MSTFETGVVKALQQPKNSFDETEENADGTLDTLSRGMGSKKLINSRKQIMNMEQGKIYTPKQLNDIGIISGSMKDVSLLNKYRNLRTKLLASSNKNNFSTLVTSITPNSGTSLIACNLAATFALEKGKTSLLIDTNINNPSLGKILNVKSEIGLTDYLESDSLFLEDIVMKTPIPRLRLLPNNNPGESASECFASEKMKDLISHLLKRYPERFIVIDSPSIATSADTRILLELCDRVVLVASYGKFTEDDLKYAIMAVGTKKFAGVILNEF